jgi:hypothetical protein
MQPGRQRTASFVPVVTIGLLCAVGVFFLAPAAAFFDSGELATTAVELGVPHPTGFPIFNLSGHLFSLLPFGGGALRVNLLGMCATCCATVALLVAAGCVLETSALASIVALAGCGLLCLAAPSVLRHARAAEIYPLVWLHAAGCLAAWLQFGGYRRAAVLAGLLGIGSMLHAESLLFAGVFGLFALIAALRTEGAPSLKLLIAGVVVTALGVLGVVYLPLAANRPAAFSWGDTSHWPEVWAHLTAASIRTAYRDEMGSGLYASALGLAAGLWRDIGVVVGAVVVGVVVAARRDWRQFTAIAAIVVIDVGYSVLINPMGLRDEQCGNIAALGLLALAALGLAETGRALVGRDKRWLWPVAVALLAVGVGRASVAVEQRPNGELRAADGLVHRTVDAIAPGGLAIVASDHVASLCSHAQIAEGSRPDALCAPAVFTRDRRMLRVLARRGERGFGAAREVLQSATDRAAMANAMAAWVRPAIRAKALAWELGSAAEDAQILSHWLPGFPTGRVVADKPTDQMFSSHLAAARRAAEAWCPADAEDCPTDGDAASYVGRWASLTASAALKLRRPGAEDLLHFALSRAPSDRSVLNNYAVFLNITGDAAAALKTCIRALRLHPDHHAILRTATRAALAVGDTPKALRFARAYLVTPPGRRSGARWLRGLLAGAPPRVRDRFNKGLADHM